MNLLNPASSEINNSTNLLFLGRLFKTLHHEIFMVFYEVPLQNFLIKTLVWGYWHAARGPPGRAWIGRSHFFINNN